MKETDWRLLEVLLDAWDRNNTIMINLLHALPNSSLGLRAVAASPTVAQTFAHLIYIRLVHVFEDAPEFAIHVPHEEWQDERSKERIERRLNESAEAVSSAVKERISAGKEMELHYDHPILMLQHMIWHEGYHHGQIKLALKVTGHPVSDEAVGVGTWGVWMGKTP